MKIAQLFERQQDALIIDIIRDALADDRVVIAEGLFYNIWLNGGKGGRIWVSGRVENEISRDTIGMPGGDKTYVSFVVDGSRDTQRMTIYLPVDTADEEYELDHGDGDTLYVYPAGAGRR